MAIRLTDDERSQLQKFARRPRSRKQLYRARAILALDEGHPLDTVARMFRVGTDRVEDWAGRFEQLRLGFLAEPAASARQDGRVRRPRGEPPED